MFVSQSFWHNLLAGCCFCFSFHWRGVIVNWKRICIWQSLHVLPDDFSCWFFPFPKFHSHFACTAVCAVFSSSILLLLSLLFRFDFWLFFILVFIFIQRMSWARNFYFIDILFFLAWFFLPLLLLLFCIYLLTLAPLILCVLFHCYDKLSCFWVKRIKKHTKTSPAIYRYQC